MKRGRPPGSKNKEPELAVSAVGTLFVPKRLRKDILSLSKSSGVSPQQVLEDVLDNGIVAVRGGMYASLIEYRKSLREQLDGEDNSTTNGDVPSGIDSVQGDNGRSINLGLDREVVYVGPVSNTEGSGERLDLAPLGPGLGTESDTALASDRGDAE